MTKKSWRPNYTQPEVRALVEGYAELNEVKSTSKFGLRVLVGLADLGRVMHRLPLKERQAVLLHGLLDLRDAETYLGVDRVTIWRWYTAGIAHLTDHLNGDGTAL